MRHGTSVTRLAHDRAEQLETDDVWEELKRRLQAVRQRGEFAAVHCVPESSGDVPDEMEVRLVILGPEHPHSGKTPDSKARKKAEEIFHNRANSPRLFKNMLVFLAPDKTRLNDLDLAIRDYLAWNSIWNERETLNLDAFQSKQAETKRGQAEETIQSRILESYVWLLAPFQPDPQGAIEWQEQRLQGKDALAVRASKRLQNDENMISQFSPSRLRLELDRYLWKDAEHLGLKKLWEYFATYLYLPRLKDSEVLISAVQAGVQQVTWSENFAYAERYDEDKKRYMGLKTGQLTSIVLDAHSLVVKPEAAQRQLEAEQEVEPPGKGEGAGEGEPGPREPGGGEVEKESKLTRFHGSVAVEPVRLGRDAGKIGEEVVQHLSGLVGSEVEITLEISVKIPDGAPDDVVRTVSENCSTLHFTTYGFEEE